MGSLQSMLALDFMRNAFLAGGCVAVAAGLVGYFVVIRNQVFTTDALGHVAFTGSLGGLLAGFDLLAGVFGHCLAVCLRFATLRGRGRVPARRCRRRSTGPSSAASKAPTSIPCKTWPSAWIACAKILGPILDG